MVRSNSAGTSIRGSGVVMQDLSVSHDHLRVVERGSGRVLGGMPFPKKAG